MMSTNNDFAESLSLTLRTPESAADAAAVASMLRAIVVLIEETSKGISEDVQVSLRVHPLREGSLEIPIEFVVVGAGSLLGFNPHLKAVLDTLKTFFDLKKLLRGSRVDERTVQNGVTIGTLNINGGNNVFNIIQDRRVEESFDQASVDLEKDSKITGVALLNNSSGEELAYIPREEFRYFRNSGDGDNVLAPADRTRTIPVTLTIHSPVLQGSAKWRFVFEGKQIAASIRDEGFLEKVSKGVEAFRNGDRLKVDLEIGEKFVPSISDYERTNQYSVVKVHDHVPSPQLQSQTPPLFAPDVR